MNQQKAIQSFRCWKCTKTYSLESVLPKGHLEETNKQTSIYPEACLVQPIRCDLLNDKAYFYELTKVRKGLLGSWILPSFHSRSPTTYNKFWKGNHWLVPWWRHSQNSGKKRKILSTSPPKGISTQWAEMQVGEPAPLENPFSSMNDPGRKTYSLKTWSSWFMYCWSLA